MSKDFGMAVAIKRRNKKKMAEGGTVKQNDKDSPPSAKSEARPMPPRKDDSGKAAKNDSWTDRSTVVQAQKPSRTPLSRPKMVGSTAFSVRDRDIAEAEDMRKMSLESTNEGPQEQPAKRMDEMDASNKGPSVPALKMKMMAKGGMMPDGSKSDQEPSMSPLDGLNDQMAPPSKEYMAGYMQAHKHLAEQNSESQAEKMMADGGDVDKTNGMATMVEQMRNSMHAPHSMNGTSSGESGLDSEDDEPMSKYAEGGKTDSKNAGGMDPGDEDDDGATMKAKGGMINLDELEDERHSSIAAAIMAKRDRMKAGSDSDDDREMMLAEGGRADLSINADEEPNNEDQMSFQALRKENYSETPGLEELDYDADSGNPGDEREDESENKHDMVGSIRKRMNMKRQFSR